VFALVSGVAVALSTTCKLLFPWINGAAEKMRSMIFSNKNNGLTPGAGVF
jgi:hypothetical protein